MASTKIERGLVVVGVDGSARSVAALHWAARYAAATGAEVRAVLAWQHPAGPVLPAPEGPNPAPEGPNPAPEGPNPAPGGPNPAPGGPNPAPGMPRAAPRDVTAKAMQDILDHAIAQAFPGDAAVQSRVISGHPAQVLIDESKEADLLVVGDSGHGAFTGMPVGSVSIHCVTSAYCPVTVVRGTVASTEVIEHD